MASVIPMCVCRIEEVGIPFHAVVLTTTPSELRNIFFVPTADTFSIVPEERDPRIVQELSWVDTPLRAFVTSHHFEEDRVHPKRWFRIRV